MSIIQPIRTRAACARPVSAIPLPIASPRTRRRTRSRTAGLRRCPPCGRCADPGSLPRPRPPTWPGISTAAVVAEVWRRRAPGLQSGRPSPMPRRSRWTPTRWILLCASVPFWDVRPGNSIGWVRRDLHGTAAAGRSARRKGIYYTPPALADLGLRPRHRRGTGLAHRPGARAGLRPAVRGILLRAAAHARCPANEAPGCPRCDRQSPARLRSRPLCRLARTGFRGSDPGRQVPGGRAACTAT